MGLTTSALQIGRSALLSYQAALQVVGNNIANVGNPDYTRQSAGLSAIPGMGEPPFSIGNGVVMGSIRRNISEANEARLRLAQSDQNSAQAEDAGLTRIESILNALGDVNLSTQLEDFFNSFGALQTSPDNSASRGVVISNGTRVSETIRRMRSDLLGLRDEQNDAIIDEVTRADTIASQIADLNTNIVMAEAGSNSPASSLRDQRDTLLRELTGIVAITTREQPGGAINVYVGNEPLVLAGDSRGLTAETVAGDDGMLTVNVRYTDNNSPVQITSGSLEGLIATRDRHAGGQLDRLEQLSKAIIFEVNKIHAQGQGLSGFSALKTANPVNSTTDALNTAAAGLTFTPKSGSFYIDVKDSVTGTVERRQIHVDLDGLNGNDTTLNSLAAQINLKVQNVSATVSADGTMTLSAADGFTYSFAEDSSDTLAALGLNTFFNGNSGADMSVSSVLRDDPNLLAASLSGLPGDGSNAGRLAALADTGVGSLGGVSIANYYDTSVGIQAVDSASAKNTQDAADAIVSALNAQRESVSGVNLDEETIKMVTYQRAYQGAAQYLSVVDEMIQTLLGLVQ